MDIPSVVAMTRQMDALTERIEALTKENEHLRRCYGHCKEVLEGMKSEKSIIIEREEGAQQQVLDLRKKYDSLKRRYREALSR